MHVVELLQWLLFVLTCGCIDVRSKKGNEGGADGTGDLEEQLLSSMGSVAGVSYGTGVTGVSMEGASAFGSLSPSEIAQKRKAARKPPNTNNMLGLGARDVHEDYEIGEVIGEGAFGLVRSCVNRRIGGEFACKTLEKSQMRRKADVEDIRREVQILMMLSSHPNVAALVGIYEDDEHVHLILELCQGGTILDAIIAQGASYSERFAARIFRKMVEVVQHCHVLGIAHRDIKPENFLLSEQGPKGIVKAADFGLSQFFRPGKMFHSLVGSPYYVAPEVLARNYGPKIDIWSLGVCAYVLLTGLPPFYGQTEDEIFDMIRHSDPDFSSKAWSPTLSAAAKDCILKMLQRDPNKRPTAEEVLRHRWLCAAAPNIPLGETLITRISSFAALTRVKRAAIVMAAQNINTEDGMTKAAQLAATLEATSMIKPLTNEYENGSKAASLIAEFDGKGSKKVKFSGVKSDASAKGEWTDFESRLKSKLGLQPDDRGTVSVEDLTAALSKYGLKKRDCENVTKNDKLLATTIEGEGKRVYLDKFLKHLMAHQTNSYLEAVRIRFRTESSQDGSEFRSMGELSNHSADVVVSEI